jgi:ABC-type Fe3+ transport system permease subunit
VVVAAIVDRTSMGAVMKSNRELLGDVAWWCLCATVIGVVSVAVFVGSFYGLVSLVKWDNRVSCNRYGDETERTVQFVEYHPFSWDCLVDTPDGWVTRDNVWSGDRS